MYLGENIFKKPLTIINELSNVTLDDVITKVDILSQHSCFIL
jgi:hypothetical protein